jgi:hypothetical protein
MAIELKVKQYGILSSGQVIECWRDGVFLAAIYPHQDGIQVVSKYLKDVIKEEVPSFTAGQWVPSAIIKLGKEPKI